MSAAVSSQNRPLDYLTASEYLAAEVHSSTKHEYIAGRAYEMPQTSGAHMVLAQNLAGMLHNRLRGSGCRFFGSNTKLSLAIPDDRYYYPDGMILCDSREFLQSCATKPTVIFEILSEETRPIDEREKCVAYRALESVQAYIVIEQICAEVTLIRRTSESWEIRRFTGLDAEADLGVHGLVLPLGELYEDIVFPA